MVRDVVPLLLVFATPSFAAGSVVKHVRAFEVEVGPFDRVLDHAEPGRRLLSLIYESQSRVARFAPFLHFGSYYRARRGGVASFSFAELPHSPVHYRPESAPPSTLCR